MLKRIAFSVFMLGSTTTFANPSPQSAGLSFAHLCQAAKAALKKLEEIYITSSRDECISDDDCVALSVEPEQTKGFNKLTAAGYLTMFDDSNFQRLEGQVGSYCGEDHLRFHADPGPSRCDQKKCVPLYDKAP